jgi:phage terminase large subunit-like protein
VIQVVPAFEDDEERKWPTLGPEICDLLEERAVFGPGSLRGKPYVIDPEVRSFIYRAYQVYPKGHPKEGRRRFQRVVLSLRKGSRKTEIGAALAFVELHPEAPVRCDGFKRKGKAWVPVGRPVTDPYIPMVAYTEEQTEELAYSALYVMVTEGPDVDLFDPGLERIMRRSGDGKAVALASSPDARDGARTTFEHMDETHRFTLPRLIEAHSTMIENLTKRPLDDPWACSTTTAYQPGENSVAEREHDYAKLVMQGKVQNSRLFFFHREASAKWDLKDYDQRRDAVAEASGEVIAEWSDIDGIAARYDEPDADRTYWERVWLNRPTQSERQAFDRPLWDSLVQPFEVKRDDLIVLGFDGARFDDATALIATHVESGWQWPLGIWERDLVATEWEVDREEVEQVLEEAFETYSVWRLYADPPEWKDELKAWAAKFGEQHVQEWWTNRRRPMSYAIKNYQTAMKTRAISHNGDRVLASHIGHAVRKYLNMWDDGQRLWIIEKERPDSPFKIDGAMAGILSWEARGDAIAAGATAKRKRSRKLVTY